MHTPVTAFKGASSTLSALKFQLSLSCSWQQLCKGQGQSTAHAGHSQVGQVSLKRDPGQASKCSTLKYFLIHLFNCLPYLNF